MHAAHTRARQFSVRLPVHDFRRERNRLSRNLNRAGGDREEHVRYAVRKQMLQPHGAGFLFRGRAVKAHAAMMMLVKQAGRKEFHAYVAARPASDGCNPLSANLNDAVFLPFSMNQRALRVNLHTVSLICARRCSTHMRTASIGAYLRLLEYSTVSVSAPPSSTHAFSRRFQSKSSSSIIVAP